jgi:hypothetical protein
MLHPLIAAAPNLEFIAEVIFFCIMGFLWLINRITTAIEAARRPPPVRRPPQPVPPQGADGPQVAQTQARQVVPPQGQPRPAGDALQGEIEEFLRRASGRREGNREGNRQPSPGQRPPAARPAITGAKVDPRRGRPAPPVVRAKPVASPPVEAADTPEAISQHVKQFLDVREFDQRTTNLSSIDEKEKQFEQNVQKTFSHELGHLKRSTLADGGDAAATAVQPIAPLNPNVLAGLFRSGVDLKRAIALNEIFQRPEHWW